MRAPAVQAGLFDKLSALSPVVKVLTIVVGGLLILLIALGIESHFYGGKLQQATQRERTLKQSFEKQFREFSELSYKRKQSIAMTAQLKQMLQNLPTQSQMDMVLKKVTQIGHEAGVSFVFFKPQSEKRHVFYADLPIKIAVLGNYHEMATFLSNIANMKQLITVQEFDIKKGLKDVLTMRLTITVYHQIQSEKK